MFVLKLYIVGISNYLIMYNAYLFHSNLEHLIITTNHNIVFIDYIVYKGGTVRENALYRAFAFHWFE